MLEQTVIAHPVEDDIVGHSPAFTNVLHQVRIVAKSDSITGAVYRVSRSTLNVGRGRFSPLRRSKA